MGRRVRKLNREREGKTSKDRKRQKKKRGEGGEKKDKQREGENIVKLLHIHVLMLLGSPTIIGN